MARWSFWESLARPVVFLGDHRQNSLVVERQTCDQRVVSSSPSRSGGRIFCSRVDFLCRLLFGVHSTLCYQCQVKDPSNSAKNAGSRRHLNTHTPLTQQRQSGLTMLSRHSMGTFQGNKHTELIKEHLALLSQLAEPLWTDPGIKSGISVCV